VCARLAECRARRKKNTLNTIVKKETRAADVKMEMGQLFFTPNTYNFPTEMP